MANSVNTVTDRLAEMAYDTSKNKLRKIGGELGKNDFLALLAAQLRYQDPLEPLKDTEFVAQLAQFSSLEQMQNMNTAMTSMSNYQAYSLIGKYAVAKGNVDGVMSQIAGIVEGIFTRDGVTFAQIGEYAMPLTTISEVYDGSSMLTPQKLIETSNHLIGRTVKADIQVLDEEAVVEEGKEPKMKIVTVEGVVTRVTVDKGEMYAFVDDGTDTPKMVPVGSIYDIKQTQAKVAAQQTESQSDDQDDQDDSVGDVGDDDDI